MSRDLEKYKNQLRNMQQYKNLTEEELTSVVQQKIEEKEIVDNLTFCVNDEEKKFAQDLLDRYLGQCSFENESDKDTLKQLIDLEILVERVKKYLKQEYNKDTPSLPTHMMEQLQDLNTQILEIKEKLGLSTKDKKDSTWLEEWNKLKKKALNHYSTHAGCNVVKCPYCQKLFYLLMKIDNLTPEKCNWFRDTVLYNESLFKLYDEKRITEDELADILGVSKFYIDLIYENLYLKDKRDNNQTKDELKRT